MAGLTLEQLKALGATTPKPQGITLDELQVRGATTQKATLEEAPPEASYWGSFVGKGRLKQNVEESAKMRADKIKESLASSDSGLKKTIDIGAQGIAGALFDPVGNIISSIIPNWVKDRFSQGSDKINKNVEKAMVEAGFTQPTPIGEEGKPKESIISGLASSLGKKIDEPTQYMIESQNQMYEQAQQIRDKAFNETNPEKKKLLEETARVLETAVIEMNKSIQETVKRRESLSRSAETTEIAGNLALMTTPTTIPNAKIQAGKVIDLTKDEASGIYNTLTKSTPEQMEQQLTKFYSKAVKPSVSGKMTIPQANKAVGNQIVAISLINKNIPKLKFIENGEEVIGRAPESMQELADAVSQTKADIFNKYNELATGANQKGATVNLSTIADELDALASNPVVADSAPEIAKYARNLANSYRARGEYDVLTTQEVIKLFNEKLNAFYRSPTPEYTTKAVVDSMVVNKLRTLADNIIEKAEGPGYAELKKQYGALKSIEKEVVHRAIVEARKNTKGLIDFADIASAAQAINWVVTGNVGALLQAGGMKAITEYYKYLNSANYNIKRMFQTASKLEKSAGKKFPKSKIVESIKNPKAGMSIEKVGTGPTNQAVNATQIKKPIQKSTQTTATTPPKAGATAQSIKNNKTLTIPKSNTEAIDKQVAIDFIDSVRLGKVGNQKVTEIERLRFEIEARRLAPKYGINPELPPSKLADAFDKVIDVPKPSPQSILLQEAKKYKSAEEFIKKIENKELKIGKDLSVFTTNKGKISNEILSFDEKELANLKKSGNSTVGQILKHDDLFSIYPELKNGKIVIKKDLNSTATSWMGKINLSEKAFTNISKLKETIKHELQHNIQTLEKRAHSTTLDQIQKKLLTESNRLYTRAQRTINEKLYEQLLAKSNEIERLALDLKHLRKLYNEHPNEIEAVLAEKGVFISDKTKSELTDIWKKANNK